MRIKSTEKHKKWWADRKIDWKTSYQNWQHPHRDLLTNVLSTLQFTSLIEIGCGGGANLMNIANRLKNKQLGGVDVNKDAIELCQKTFANGLFKVNSADNVMLSDKSTDITLSDMVLIYAGPTKIDKYIKEVRRITRNYVVFCEFHSKNWWNKLALRVNSGYNAYDYNKLLAKHGFYDIVSYKLQDKDWPGEDGQVHEPQKTFAHIIVARVPKRY